MTPKDALQTAFGAIVSPRLQELSFVYSSSQFAYRRKVGVFTQHISITLSHRNTQESMVFWSAFNVSSPQYNKWRQGEGLDCFEGYLGGNMDWNIPGWRDQGDFATSFDFSRPDMRETVLKEWLRRCVSCGIPYLESLSSWEALADDLLRSDWHWERAADYCLIAGKVDKAIAALNAGVAFLLRQEFSYSANAHPTLVMKRKREASKRDEKVQSYRDRITQLQRSNATC